MEENLTNLAQRRDRPQLSDNTGFESTEISALCSEIIHHIFSFLSLDDKRRVAQVCFSWRNICYHKSLWRGVVSKLDADAADEATLNSLVQRGIRRVQIISFRTKFDKVIHSIPDLYSLNLSGCKKLRDIRFYESIDITLPFLTELNLSYCKNLTDRSVCTIVKYMKSLQILDFSGNDYLSNVGILHIASCLQYLKSLNLRSCRRVSNKGISHIAGINPVGISPQEYIKGNLELEFLGLKDCQKISDDALIFIGIGLKKLKSINLSFCKHITDIGIQQLAKIRTLQDINLQACKSITGVSMAFLAQAHLEIISLDLSFCKNIGDQALCYISRGLVHIQYLSLNACNVSDIGVKAIAINLRDLKILKLGQCKYVSNNALSVIGRSLCNLQYIDLYGCPRVSGLGLKMLSKRPGLSSINLNLCQEW